MSGADERGAAARARGSQTTSQRIARRLALPLAAAAAIVVVDQLTKAAALSLLELHRPVSVLPVFDLMLTFNTGAAFSLLRDAGGWQRWLFIALAVGVSVLLVWWLASLPVAARWTRAALATILGGAVGNLLDRMFRDGRVVDFLYFHYRDFHWPAFNVADAAICIGAAILLLQSLRGRED